MFGCKRLRACMFTCRNYLFWKVGRVRFTIIQIIRRDWLPGSFFLITFAPNDCFFFLIFYFVFSFFLGKSPKDLHSADNHVVFGVRNLKDYVFSCTGYQRKKYNLCCTLVATVCGLKCFDSDFTNEYQHRQKKKMNTIETIFLHAVPL